MASFGRDLAALALQSRPQVQGSRSRQPYVPASSTTTEGYAPMGEQLGKGISKGLMQNLDPDAQRQRALQTRDLLLSMSDQQRRIVIQNPQVQRQLKTYARYLPTAFADAYSLDPKSPELEGFLTAVDDKYYEQKYRAGETQISSEQASTGVKKAQEKALTGSEQRNQELHQFEVLLRKLAPEKTQAEIDAILQGVKESKELLQARKKALTTQTEAEKSRIKTEDLLREARLLDLRAGTKATEEQTETEKVLRQPRKEALESSTAEQVRKTAEEKNLEGVREKQAIANVHKTWTDIDYEKAMTQAKEANDTLEKAKMASKDKAVARLIEGAQKDISDLADASKYSVDPSKKDYTLGYLNVTNSVLTSLPTMRVYDPVQGGMVGGIPYVATDPSVLSFAYMGLKQAYDAVRYNKQRLSGDDLERIFRETKTLFNSSFKVVDELNSSGVVPPEAKSFLTDNLPWDMYYYIMYNAVGDTMDAKTKKTVEDALLAAGMLDPVELKEKKQGKGNFSWGMGQ